MFWKFQLHDYPLKKQVPETWKGFLKLLFPFRNKSGVKLFVFARPAGKKKKTHEKFLYSLLSLTTIAHVKKFPPFYLGANSIQIWLNVRAQKKPWWRQGKNATPYTVPSHCNSEPQSLGLVPRHRGYFYDGGKKQICLCVQDRSTHTSTDTIHPSLLLWCIP